MKILEIFMNCIIRESLNSSEKTYVFYFIIHITPHITKPQMAYPVTYQKYTDCTKEFFTCRVSRGINVRTLSVLKLVP
jgi:hypothetical protein